MQVLERGFIFPTYSVLGGKRPHGKQVQNLLSSSIGNKKGKPFKWEEANAHNNYDIYEMETKNYNFFNLIIKQAYIIMKIWSNLELS